MGVEIREAWWDECEANTKCGGDVITCSVSRRDGVCCWIVSYLSAFNEPD